MSFGDIFNLVEIAYKAIEQDPLSYMVVYPMSLMTSSMLFFALIQDLLPVYRTKLAHATAKHSVKARTAQANKRHFKASSRVQFSN